jgi:hypothetical protein
MTWGPLFGSAVVAAIVAAVASGLAGRHKALREDRERRRKMFADAYGAYAAYREFPFVIRRRRADKPGDERARIGEELRHIQQELGYYIAWTKIENTQVGEAYSKLIAAARRTAGREMNRAWAESPPVSDDVQMNITDVNLDGCDELEDAYIEAVRRHLRPWVSLFTRQPKRVPGAIAPDPKYLTKPSRQQGDGEEATGSHRPRR